MGTHLRRCSGCPCSSNLCSSSRPRRMTKPTILIRASLPNGFRWKIIADGKTVKSGTPGTAHWPEDYGYDFIRDSRIRAVPMTGRTLPTLAPLRRGFLRLRFLNLPVFGYDRGSGPHEQSVGNPHRNDFRPTCSAISCPMSQCRRSGHVALT